MKKAVLLLLMALTIFSCGKDEPNTPVTPPDPPGEAASSIIVAIVGDAQNVTPSNAVNLTVRDNLGRDVTAQSKLYVGGTEISSNNYTFTKVGINDVTAKYKTLTSPKFQVKVKSTADEVVARHTSKAVINFFTATWCGYCSEADLFIHEVQEAYPDNVIPVSVHVRDSGPGNDGSFTYTRYSNFSSVRGTPTLWYNFSSTDDNITSTRLDRLVKSKRYMGIAINYDNKNENVTVKVRYDKLSSKNKIVAYLVEGDLKANQSNYYNNDPNRRAYKKGNPIPNVTYDNIVRERLSMSDFGDSISSNDVLNNIYTVNYSLKNKKSRVKNIENTKVVAFVLDQNGVAINAQIADINENKDFD